MSMFSQVANKKEVAAALDKWVLDNPSKDILDPVVLSKELNIAYDDIYSVLSHAAMWFNLDRGYMINEKLFYNDLNQAASEIGDLHSATVAFKKLSVLENFVINKVGDFVYLVSAKSNFKYDKTLNSIVTDESRNNGITLVWEGKLESNIWFKESFPELKEDDFYTHVPLTGGRYTVRFLVMPCSYIADI